MKKFLIVSLSVFIAVPLAFVFFASPKEKKEKIPLPQNAKEILARADKGDARNQYLAARGFFYGEDGFEKDLEKGFEYAKKAAAEGDSDARFELGLAYKYGKGTHKNLEGAIENLTKAAEADVNAAFPELATLYESAKAPRLAAEWHEKAAERGDGDSMKKTADGYCKTKEEEKCFLWTEKLARRGEVKYMKDLANYYLGGYGTDRSNADAVLWYSRAAEKGDTESMFNLGQSYAEELFTPRNPKLAFEWTEKAAKAGNTDASVYLGRMYAEGGVIKQDLSAAKFWLTKPAQAGDSGAAYRLGLALEEQGNNEALHWLTKAAEAKYPGAASALAGWYMDRKKYKDAFNRAHKGAILKEPLSMNILGIAYGSGLGTSPDKNKSFYWLNRALSLEPSSAVYNYNVGSAYMSVKGDYRTGFLFIKKAASMDYKDAMIKLSEMYKKGLGTPKNEEEAKKWAEKAVRTPDQKTNLYNFRE